MVNGILMKGWRLVIPQCMRKEMLDTLHVGHLGAEKQKRVARMSLYWPNMNKDIDDMVQRCGVCLKYRPALPRDKLMDIEDKRKGPWEQVGADLMHWEGKEYVVLVDYYSNYPTLGMLNS